MIREMEIQDLDRIIEIENLCFSDKWGKEQYRYQIEDCEFSTMYVCEKDGLIVAYAGYMQLFETAELLTIAVHPDFQQQGIGEKMLKKLIVKAINDGCEVLSLEVRVSNFKAINLYEKYGFIKTRTRKDYYPDNYEDAYEMMKPIGGLNEKDICDRK